MEPQLDPKLTFDTFVSGSGNRLAASAALRSAESPGTICNPLVIHGPAGMGKTHLMHAIGHRAREVQPRLQVVYEPLETFVGRLKTALTDSRVERFRKESLGIDVLLLDDVQFLAGKVRIQEELLPVWDSMGRNGAQIVLACDRAPTDIDGLDMRLTARFARGLIVDVASPDVETRRAIVLRKVEQWGARLHDGVADELARLVKGSVRDLQQSLERILRVQQREGTAIVAAEVGPLLGISDVVSPRQVVHVAPEQVSEDNPFATFLTDITAVVEEVVASSPWRQQLAEAILYWGGEGLRTWRLEAALESEDGEEAESVIAGFAADAARLREIASELAQLDGAAAGDAVLRDPDRLGEAEALLLSTRMQTSPLPGPPEDLTLDSFAAEGEGTSAAVTLAQQVASGVDPAQNPFFLAGRKEKTRHLLAGIANAVRTSRPNARIAFLTGNEMATELAAAVENRYLQGWRQRYRSLDLLVIDDFEPLLAAEFTEPLLGLLEHLLRASVPIAVSARTTPRRIAGLDPRLLSRLEGGLVLDLASVGPRRAGMARATMPRGPGGAPDRWFMNREKLAWDWVALPERVIEELG